MKKHLFFGLFTALAIVLTSIVTNLQLGYAAWERVSGEQQQLDINKNDRFNLAFVEEGTSSFSTIRSHKQNDLSNDGNFNLGATLERVNSEQAVNEIEQTWKRDFQTYFQYNFSASLRSPKEIIATLENLAERTGKKTALIYAVPTTDKLELVLVLPYQKAIRKTVTETNKDLLLATVKKFTREITDSAQLNTDSYLPIAEQFYRWIVSPLESDLKANQIDTLIFCVGSGLRSLPLAALYDGKEFLVEKYSLALIPAFNMTDPTYEDVKNSPVLAMGASQFQEQEPLIAVPVELSAILQNFSSISLPNSDRGEEFLNNEFTVDNLKTQRASQRFRIVHLATHAEFKSGAPQNSYIQFWDSKLTLDRMRELQWNNPPVELLVLSACRTAVGDKDAEMGFAGLAVNSGVKSAIATLWSVSDLGTLTLMTEFYQHLRVAPIKAEALRQAQIAMLRGEARFEDGKLRGPMLGEGVSLPAQLAAFGNTNFKHPFYWAPFTMIGSPW